MKILAEIAHTIGWVVVAYLCVAVPFWICAVVVFKIYFKKNPKEVEP